MSQRTNPYQYGKILTAEEESHVAVTLHDALSKALSTWAQREPMTLVRDSINVAVGAIIGFAAIQSAGVRSHGPLRERFIRETVEIFETALREACELEDHQMRGEGR